MNKRLRILFCLTLLSSVTSYCATSFAATEFKDSIPLELVKLMLDNNQLVGDVSIYTDLPDDFPEFSPVASFQLLGSIDQANFIQRVFFQTQDSADTANLAVVTAFTAENWVEISSPFQNQAQGGFVSATPRPSSNQLCHDDLGTILVSSRINDNGSLVSISRYQYQLINANQPSCNEQQNQRQGLVLARSRNDGLQQYLPRLEVPTDANSPQLPTLGRVAGYSGSNADIETSFTLSIDWSLAEVLTYFNAQLEQQNWGQDENSSGDYTANSSWTLSPNEDANLLGMLSIAKTADELYQLKFRLLTIAH